MKQVGDSIQWNSKSGPMTGVIEKVRIIARYIVKIDGSDMNVELFDSVRPEGLNSETEAVEFMQAVQQMRDAQKRYFDTRDAAVLNESKMLEKKVDAILSMRLYPNLFNNQNSK